MSMTKKDFAVLADALVKAYQIQEAEVLNTYTINKVYNIIVFALQDEYDNFDAVKFREHIVKALEPALQS